MDAFDTLRKYYDLPRRDKIKNYNFHASITHRNPFISSHFRLHATTSGIIKFRLLGRDSAAEERVRLHKRGAGKGVVEEEEAAAR